MTVMMRRPRGILLESDPTRSGKLLGTSAGGPPGHTIWSLPAATAAWAVPRPHRCTPFCARGSELVAGLPVRTAEVQPIQAQPHPNDSSASKGAGWRAHGATSLVDD